MTTDEKYDSRLRLLRILRTLEDEIEKLTNVKNEYNNSENNKKATLNISVKGKNIQYELGDKDINRCLETIIHSFNVQKNDIVETLKQELK